MARPKDIAGNKIRRGDYLVRTQEWIDISPLYKFLSKGRYVPSKEDLNQPQKLFNRIYKTGDYVKVVEIISPPLPPRTIPWMEKGVITPAEYMYVGGTQVIKVPKNLCEPTINVEGIKMFLALAGYPLKEEKEDDS